MTEAISMELKRINVGDILLTEYGELEVIDGTWVCEPGAQLTVDAAGRVDGNHGKMVVRYSVQTARGNDDLTAFLFPTTGKLVAVNRNRISAPIQWVADLPSPLMVRPRDPTLCTSECTCM